MKKADLVIIVTDHSSYDYHDIVKNAPMIMDTRNATQGVAIGRNGIYKL